MMGRIYDPATRDEAVVDIVNLSHEGAALRLGFHMAVPDNFDLLVGGSGRVRRQCQVVRREKMTLGVRFLDRPDVARG